MKSLRVELGSRSYNILIGEGLLSETGKRISEIFRPQRIFVVTDDTVKELYWETVKASLLTEGFDVKLKSFTPGESTKTMESLQKLYTEAFAFGMTRSDLIIALGGGVIGDLTGFFASTLLRGVPFVQIPTTLLAQVDSSVGGKVAINVPQGKNLVGSFYQPKLVLIDPETLKSLSDAIFSDGMAEVIKYGCIFSKNLFNRLSNYCNREAMGDELTEIIYECCNAKRIVVEADELDCGKRMLLNFGHTMGHAVEKLYHYEGYTHGQAVAAGMVLASKFGEKEKITELGTTESICRLLAQYQLPTQIAINSEWNDVIALDKKMKRSTIHLALLKSIGSGIIKEIPKDEFVLKMNKLI